MPRRLHFSRTTKGERLPPGARLVTRPGRFGNRVSLPAARTREAHAEAAAAYLAWATAEDQAEFRSLVRAELCGLDLACSCPEGWPCHADVLLRIANEDE